MPISVSVEYSYGMCPLHMRRAADKACQWYSDQVLDKHFLQVVLVNASVIGTATKNSYGDHGIIWYEEKCEEKELFVIQVAANLECLNKKREDTINVMLSTIFHEFVHYEQLRDGKKIWERGVDKRAKKLLEEFNEDVDV